MAASACAVACASAGLPPGTVEPPPRQPDGVFLDVPPAKPAPRAVARAGGVVSLTLPVSDAEVQTLVRGYFHAFVSGDAASFAPLLAAGARRMDEGSSSAALATSLVLRLRTVDYTHLPFDSLAAYDQLRIVPFESAPEELRLSEGMHDGDVVVDVAVRVQRSGGVRVFGPRMRFVLRKGEGAGERGWQIASVRETDGPWS